MYLYFVLLIGGWGTTNAQNGGTTNAENIFQINSIDLNVLPSNELKSGNKMDLNCSVELAKNKEFQLKYHFFFYKNDDLFYNVSSNTEAVFYTINQTRVSNSGIYTCKVVVEDKEKTTDERQVNITGLPKPILNLSTNSAKEGEEVSMTCEIPEEATMYYFTFYKTKNEEKTIIKSKFTTTNQFKTTYTFLAGEREVRFECTVKLQFATKDEMSQPSDRQMVAVAEPFSTPKMYVYPSTNITEGQNITVTCSIIKSSIRSKIDSNPVEITIQKDKVILVSSKEETAIYFQLATVNQMGNYTCKAELNSIMKTANVYIHVTELFPKPRLNSSIQSSDINEGSILSFSCFVPGFAHNESYYLLRNKATRIVMNKDGQYSIRAMENNAGSYVCEVTISNITKKSNSINVTVYAPVSKPVLTHINKSNRMVVLGQTLELSCKSEHGTHPINYSLSREDENLGKIEVYKNEAAVFKVNVTKQHDLRQYTCKAENRNTASRQSSDTINITVITPVSNVTLTIIPSNGEVEEGAELTLICKVQKGSLPIYFSFYVKKGKDEFLHNTTKDNEDFAEHEIQSFSKQRDGSYYCIASNKAGHQIQSNPLPVRGVLARWKKGIISCFVIFIIIAAIGIIIYLYVDRKKKDRGATLDNARTTNSTNSNPEKLTIKNEEVSYFVSGTSQTEDENHVDKMAEEKTGNSKENCEVEYTEVDVALPNTHLAPGTDKKGTDAVYSEIRKSNHDAAENNLNRINDSPPDAT
ncbi:platelet endothelial cell adhesion molecule isoform X2 [Bombina bombina]|uniref:platelet endothelial cell adhesion molecule isoform X2 n=1 Tax=Bombina bombina TaxID=8345 RepID=UPI00235A6CBB|nr:platelet endothelial cell adhesion molecule isoform X2 [Bombina bombina]